ncbi:protein phosphatase 2C 37-like isoform X2 [Gastrolobium bilobum]|uniref:protein phosphatase 2C 37-like isoform X2 n=1 Tax=Gastrolobium bilobum TaxID=150636 RepID=UPI002AB210E3|nr:protein phosphatase 2C 37-like isoform X2 [Gastrolobium bilobum]
MAGICCGVVGEGETPAPIEPSSRPSRRRSLDLLPLKYMADMAVPSSDTSRKRHRLDLCPKDCEESSAVDEEDPKRSKVSSSSSSTVGDLEVEECPKFGVTSVCGRRRDMEDSVSVHPSFSQEKFNYFGVFDGHGCSHVATMCKERLHEIVKEEIHVARENLEWKSTMEHAFARMDDEVQSWSQSNQTSPCRCELQTPHCDAVGSTAVVAVVTQDKLVVSNCGDSRAVLCRKGVAIPLSSDHKPDRPDELLRVQAAGGRVIYWDGPRVLGVLAMSRAIGDNYLKPYVISEPEVTVTERSDEDECLILASDGLWDVVSNDTACGVVRMCLKAQKLPSPPPGSPGSDVAADGSDRACSDASILLTKLALARHSSDNVSVVVVDLRRDQQQQQSSNSNDC